jgi:Tol biopolymer transport system component
MSARAASGLFVAAALASATLAAQTPAQPRLLAPGIVSTGDIEFSPALSPDGKTLYFTKGSPGNRRVMWILVSQLAGGGGSWSKPVIAPFSGRYSDIDATLSPDGKRLFFASTRPLEGDGEAKKDFDIWVADKTAAGWSAPVNLGPAVNSAGSETTTSVTADGTLYIGASGRDGTARTGRRLYVSRLVGGTYQTPEPMPAPIDAGEEDSNQFVSPDGRFMIYMSRRAGAEAALYVTYSEAGGWSAPERLAAKWNTDYSPYTPLLSPDGKTFYFTSQKGVFEKPPIAPMSYDAFVEAIRSPGNGLGDIFTVPAEALGLRPAPSR